MCLSVLPGSVYPCTICVPSAHRSQKRVLGHLGLELWTVVSSNVGSRKQAQVLCGNKGSELSVQPLAVT